MSSPIPPRAQVSFRAGDGFPDWAPSAAPDTILTGRFLYITNHVLPSQHLRGLARIEMTDAIVDYDDDGMDDDGSPIMRPIYARYYVPVDRLTVVE